ncbi:hypothetical protein [Burkholderia sp. IDO3]|uniref:hypothetical protein n=1 Tax=Burkholderia sp. IDO3 TaxID=1705310 RepID=UPI000BBAE603|nr:hypothetical protein [Burkholderia sp. IDO3]
MRVWPIPIIVAVMLSGCASTESVKASQEQGVHRVYTAPYNSVYAATLAAVKAKELELVESDPAAGRIVVSHGISLLSWGERIAIWLRPLNESNTDVAIVSKPILAPLNFPPDWTSKLFEQIATELGTPKTK